MLISLLSFTSQICAKELSTSGSYNLQNFTGKLIDTMVNRLFAHALRALPIRHVDIENTTLALSYPVPSASLPIHRSPYLGPDAPVPNPPRSLPIAFAKKKVEKLISADTLAA